MQFMAAVVIDGKKVAAAVRAELAEEVSRLKSRGITPGLGVILVGEDPASHSYVKGKVKACAEVGLHSVVEHLPGTISQADLMEKVKTLNEDPSIHGFLVQLPLPDGLSAREVIEAIDPGKDVDGFHPVNIGRLQIGDRSALVPCTPAGVIALLQHAGVAMAGKHAVVVGRSNIVGKPVAQLLLRENATVTVCHSQTRDLAVLTRQADILIAAVGRPNTITADMVRPGAAVIDVGVNRVGGRLVGDVDFDSVCETAGYITPVPGGVGPMTITMLLKNTIEAAKRRIAP
jgi:methylenetetrahydrofolate dehydrogenase (NADP+)/methenyltetrahydrofolate cyclohydrolase